MFVHNHCAHDFNEKYELMVCVGGRCILRSEYKLESVKC